jgi:hypothetical protein
MATQSSITPELVVEEPGPARIPTRYVVLGTVGVVILFLVIVGVTLYLAANFAPEIEAIRDIFIIALALQSCVFAVILVIMLLMIIRLVNMLEFEIKPILERTNETVGMVRGTTTFVSKNVVSPVTRASAYVAGARRAIQVLFGDPRKNF